MSQGVYPQDRSHSRLADLINDDHPQYVKDTGDTLVGTYIITSSGTGIIPLAVKGFAGQTADLQQWQNSSGSVLSRIDSSGQFYGTAFLNSGSRVQSGGSTVIFDVHNLGANTRRVRIQIDDAAPLATIAATYGSGGQFPLNVLLGNSEVARFNPATLGPALVVTPTTASGIALVAKGFTSQTVDLQQWQNSAGTSLASISASGNFYVQPTVNTPAGLTIRQAWNPSIGGANNTSHLRLLSTDAVAADVGSSIAMGGQSNPTADFAWVTLASRKQGATSDRGYFQIVMNGGSVTGEMFRITADGTVGIHESAPGGTLGVTPANAAHIALVLKGAASQTGDLTRWQDSAGSTLAFMSASGGLTTAGLISTGVLRGQGAVTETALGIDRLDIGVTAGTPRIVFEDAGSTIWEVDNNAGQFRLYMPGVVRAAFGGSATTDVGFYVKGITSQTGDLQQWQDTAGTILAKVTNIGNISAVGYRINDTAPSGQYLRGNGTNFVNSAIQASDVPVLNQNTTGTARYVESRDTRAVNDEPDDFDVSVKFDFKANATNGLADGGTYNGVMTWRKYGFGTDVSGGPIAQIAYTDNANLWMRLSTSGTAWGTWVKIFNTNNAFDATLPATVALATATSTAGSAAIAARRDHTHGVTGILPIANGGTNSTATATLGGVGYGTGTAHAYTAAGTAKQVIASNGAAAPTWQSLDLTYMPDAWVKKSVRVATTANITLSGTQTIDGVAVVANDRVLVKNQSTPAQNGIYIVAAGAWTRATGADSAVEAAGAVVFVDSGTANGGQHWETNFRATDTLGTTAMNWYINMDTSGFATPTIALSTAAAAGSANTFIRSDSTIAAFDATAPSTQAFGDAAVVGVINFAARRDHKHAMPANPVSYATPAITLGTANAAGSAATLIRSDATILAFDATTPTFINLSNTTSSVGSAAVAARRDHIHGVAATLQIANGGTGSTTRNFVDLVSSETIGGAKTFSSPMVVVGSITVAPSDPNEGGEITFQPGSSYTGDTTIDRYQDRLRVHHNGVERFGLDLTNGQVMVYHPGTASTPAITFSGDTNTGIFKDAGATLSIATGGQRAALFDINSNNIFGPLTMNDKVQGQYFVGTGFGGASTQTRWVGGTTSGAPASGIYVVGDWIVARNGAIWVCTGSGAPGTWTQVGGGGSYVDLTTNQTVAGNKTWTGTSAFNSSVAINQTAAVSAYALSAAATTTGTSTSANAATFDATDNGTTGFANALTAQSYKSATSTGTTGGLTGGYFLVSNFHTTAAVGSATALYVGMPQSSGGAITTAYGIRVSAGNAGTTKYGIRIEDLGTGSTSNYALSIAGASTWSSVGGFLAVGGAVGGTTEGKLLVRDNQADTVIGLWNESAASTSNYSRLNLVANSSTGLRTTSDIRSRLTVTTDASMVGEFTVRTRNAGVLAERIAILGDRIETRNNTTVDLAHADVMYWMTVGV